MGEGRGKGGGGLGCNSTTNQFKAMENLVKVIKNFYVLSVIIIRRLCDLFFILIYS